MRLLRLIELRHVACAILLLDDPRPEKFRNIAGYNDHVRSTVINCITLTSHDLAIRYLYPKADLQAAVHDHKYSVHSPSTGLKIQYR